MKVIREREGQLQRAGGDPAMFRGLGFSGPVPF